MPFFQFDPSWDAKIHFEVKPWNLPGKTVFIHGNLASRGWWYPIAECGASATPRGEMILLEFLGCGQSTAPRDQNDVDLSKFAENFVSLLRNLGPGPYNLVGHSTGGTIAALMISQAPELFTKAVLLDPVGATGVRFQEAMTQAFEAMKNDRALTAQIIGSTIYQNRVDPQFFNDVIVADAFHAVKTVGDKVLRAIDGLEIRIEMTQIQRPVLVLHGEHDSLLSMDESRALAKLIPQGEFRVLPDMGHCGNVEKPAELFAVLQSYLTS